jgi:resuscitation-promoting factor RpfB
VDAADLDDEVAPVVRVKRSRLALAMAVTTVAVPLLVLDNFPATADTSDQVEVAVADDTSTSSSTTQLPTTTSAPSTTEVVVVTTEAPTSTTAAPTTTTTAAPVVRALAAPRVTTTTAAPAPPPPPKAGDPNDPASWDRMAQCEAGGNWAANTGNGYYGGLQFSVATWESYGGTGYPHEASKATQIAIGQRLQAARGWGAWPGCARELGYL